MTALTAPAARLERRPTPRRAWAIVIGGSVLSGLLAGQLMASGHVAAVLVIAIVLLPIFLWQKPEYGPAVALFSALLVEQFGYTVGPRAGAATAQIPLFHGIGALHISPADLLLLLIATIYVAQLGTGTVRRLPNSLLATAIYVLLALVLLGVAVGLQHGGEMRFAMTETRPYVYLLTTFVLASTLVTTPTAVRAILWTLVVTIAFKAGQGLLIFWSIRGFAIRPEAVLGHEEAVFFAVFLFLVLALWLFEVPGRLRLTATALAPLVIAADLANTRRAAWVVLTAGLFVLLVAACVALPSRRRLVGAIIAALTLGMAIYLPAYWNKTGGFAQPARAVHSLVAPSPRDQSSDLYRAQEEANLKLNIREAGPLGKGFGVPIDYRLPIADISSIDPLIAYIPHNGVLYVLMRMGVLGSIAFWSMLGLGIVAACRLLKSSDRELGALGAVAAALLVAYVFEGYVDQGFFFYRVAFVVGTMLGLCEAAGGLFREDAKPAQS